MSDKTKLAWKKFALKLARKIMWRLDEWLHAQEIKLREVVEPITAPVLVEDTAVKFVEHADADEVEEAVAPVAAPRERKTRAKRRRGIPAAAFDLRFSQ